jgi:tetratricopeptide (TPR) repeat protein
MFIHIVKQVNRYLCLLLACAALPMLSSAVQPEIDSLSNLLLDPSLKHATRVRVKIELSKLYASFNPEEAYREIGEASALCQQAENEPLRVEVLGQLGVLLYQNSLYDSSIYTFKQVIAISEKKNLQAPLVHAYMNIANNYLDLARFNLALDYYIKALNLCRKLPKPEKTEASIMANIAIVYSNKEEYDKAIEYFKKHLAIVNKLAIGADEKAVAYLEIANAYQSDKKDKLAKKYTDSASKFLSQCVDRYTFCLYHQIAGNIAYDASSYNEAEEHFKQAILEAKKIDYTIGLVDVLLRSGKNYMKAQKTLQAESAFKEAIRLGESIKTYQLIAGAEKELGNLYLSKNMVREAAEHFKLHSQYTDSTVVNEKNNLTKEMQARFEMQEKAFELEQIKMGKDQEIEIQRIYTIVSIIIAIIFMCFAVFEFLRYRNKRNLNNELIKLNQEILMQKNELQQQAQTLAILSKEIEAQNKLLEYENEEKGDRLVEYAFYNAHGLRSAVSNIKGLINIINLKFHEEGEIGPIVEMLGKSTENLDDIVIDFGKKLVAHKYKGDIK